jgi:hypothetical protein
MQGSFSAFLDASVLYPVSLRNLLMGLTLSGLFQARWSADVHEEWIRAVRRDRPDIPIERLQSVRAAMDRHAGDCLVTGYEQLIGSFTLPDPNDRHVLAAAIVGGADVIVTRNLRDFPADVLGRQGCSTLSLRTPVSPSCNTFGAKRGSGNETGFSNRRKSDS